MTNNSCSAVKNKLNFCTKLIIYAQFILCLVICFSCDETSISGNFVKVSQPTKISIDFSKLEIPEIGLIDELHFGEKFCRYNFKVLKQSAKYWIEDGYIHIGTGNSGNLTLRIIDSNTLNGEGFISGEFKKIK